MAALKLMRFDNAAAFYDRVTSALLPREAQNNIIFGLRQGIEAGMYAELPYMACVEEEGRVVAVVLRTPPHQVHLAQVTEMTALPLIASDLHALYPALPSVSAEPPVAAAFAALWSQMCNAHYTLNMLQGVYQLTRVRPPLGIAGTMRAADEDDVPRIAAWMMAFEAEIWGREVLTANAERGARMRIPSDPDRGFRLWLDEGHIVSMAGYTGRTPNGIRVNAVYTPPEWRGRGYASACVAALSEELLGMGRRFCFLFTDMANSTSNKIYQQIGYELMGQMHIYHFH